MKLKLLHKQQIAKDSWEFIFEKPDNFVYDPGQYIEITLEHQGQDDRGAKRWFTLSSSPTESDIMITTRLVEKRSSFKQALFELNPGDSIEAHGPMGSFTMPLDSEIPIVWIAGGIGITPFRSQMKFLTDNKISNRKITLIYSNRSNDDICFEEVWIKALEQNNNFKYIQTLVDTVPNGWGGEKGMIDIDMIKRAIGEFEDKIFYISGPEPMVDSFKPMLMNEGVLEKNIRQDWFPNYTDKF